MSRGNFIKHLSGAFFIPVRAGGAPLSARDFVVLQPEMNVYQYGTE